MMLVYLVRQFTFDQVNHIAKNRNPKLAVELDIEICRNLKKSEEIPFFPLNSK